MKRTIIILSTLITLSLAGMAQPKTPTKTKVEPLISSITLERFQAIVQAMGFDCTRGSQKDGKPDLFFSFNAESRKITATVDPDNPNTAFLLAVFTDKLPLDFYNDWNRLYQHRAYLNEYGASSIEADIILTGGITQENFETQIKNFRESVVGFTRMIADREAKDAQGKQQ